MTFEHFGLSGAVLKAIGEIGYETPTPIQEQSIPIVLGGRDVLGSAQTGTGKTASFTLPMIDILASGRAKARMPRSLILTPTRELAAQIAESFNGFSKYQKLSMALLIGGVSLNEQKIALAKGVDVLIATPGRLIDHLERGGIMLHDVKILVIDEADRMLDMGFIPDVERITKLLPRQRQTLFYSATLDEKMRQIADQFTANPQIIEVAVPASTADTVTQSCVHTTPEGKVDTLRQLLGGEDIINAVIFCNRKRDIATLQRSLHRHGFNALALHGDMTQMARNKALAAFKSGDAPILVASDVAARGLDIEGLSHVFNFDVPMNPEDYVHRIGRTGRAGREGCAITLVASDDDKEAIDAIETLIGKSITQGQIIPSAKGTSVRDSRGTAASKGTSTKDASVRDTSVRETARKGTSVRGKKTNRHPYNRAKKPRVPGPRRDGRKTPPTNPFTERPAPADSTGDSFRTTDHVPNFLR